MKVLATTQQVLTLLCICPIDDSTKKWKKLFYIVFSITVLSILLTQIVASTVFMIKYLSVDLERTLYAVYQIFGWLPIFYSFIIALFLRREISALFIGLSGIYNECNVFELIQRIHKTYFYYNFLFILFTTFKIQMVKKIRIIF